MPVAFLSRLSAADVERWRQLLNGAIGEPILIGPDAAADIAVVANPAPNQLVTMASLKFIQSAWAGVDGLLTDPTLPQVPLARLIDPDLAQAMAESVAAHVLAIHRQFPLYRAQQQAAVWAQHFQPAARTCKVGLLGYGEMGKATGKMLTDIGFPVATWTRSKGDLDALLAESDIVVSLLPLTPETRGVLNAGLFARMKPGAAIISAGRGGHLVEADLLAALESGQIGHAVLDVFGVEPLPADHPFWRHAKVTITPHVAAVTDPANSAALIAANIRRFRAGGPVVGLVAREAGY